MRAGRAGCSARRRPEQPPPEKPGEVGVGAETGSLDTRGPGLRHQTPAAAAGGPAPPGGPPARHLRGVDTKAVPTNANLLQRRPQEWTITPPVRAPLPGRRPAPGATRR